MSHEKMFTNLDLDVLYTIMNGQRNSHTNIIFTQNETMKAHTFYKISSLPCLVMREHEGASHESGYQIFQK